MIFIIFKIDIQQILSNICVYNEIIENSVEIIYCVMIFMMLDVSNMS